MSSNLSISKVFICTLNFGLWWFIKVCKNMFLIFYRNFWFILNIHFIIQGSMLDCFIFFNRHWIFEFSLGGISSIVTENYWTMFDLGACKKSFKEFSKGNWLPCFSLVDLHSLVQYCPLLNLLHSPENWDFCFCHSQKKKGIPRSNAHQYMIST